jgi:hypothetical protein
MKNIPQYIVLHHSANQDHGTLDYMGLWDWHVNHNGWRDIGYHFVIERIPRYTVIMGRMPDEVGAHCKGVNKKSLGVCFVGDFDSFSVPKEQWDLGIRLVEYLIDMYNIPIGNVRGHRDLWNTACPGKHFKMSDFINDLLRRC